MPDIDIERELDSDEEEELVTVPDVPLQRNDDEEAINLFTFKFQTLALDPANRRYQGKSR